MLHYPRAGALLLVVVACCTTAPPTEAAMLRGQHDVADHQKSSAEVDSGQLLSLLNGVFGDTNVVEHLASVQYDGVSDEPLLEHMKEVSKTLAAGPPQRTQVARPRFNPLAKRIRSTDPAEDYPGRVIIVPAQEPEVADFEANPIWKLLRSLYMPEVVLDIMHRDFNQSLVEQGGHHKRLFWNARNRGTEFKKEISMLLRNFHVSLKMAHDPKILDGLTEADLCSSEDEEDGLAYSSDVDLYRRRRKLVTESLARLQATARFHSHALFRDGALGDEQIPSLLQGKVLTTDIKSFRVSPSPEKSKGSEWWDDAREMSREKRDKPLQLQVLLQPTIRDVESGRLIESGTIRTKFFFDEKNEWDHDDTNDGGSNRENVFSGFSWKRGPASRKEVMALAEWWQRRSLRLVFFFKGGKLVKWQMEAGLGQVDRLIVEPKGKEPLLVAAASSEDPPTGASCTPGKQRQERQTSGVEEKLCKEVDEKLHVTIGRVGPPKTDAAVEAGDTPAPADATREPTPYNNSAGLFDFDALEEDEDPKPKMSKESRGA